MYMFDPLYLVFAIPGLILSLLASAYVKSTFSRYSRVPSSRGLTGAQAAWQMLHAAGVNNVRIDTTTGFLGDYYDPSHNTLHLSPEVYGSTSISAIGVACHEAGHALQQASGYAWLGLRSGMVPAANIGSNLSYFLILIGLIFQTPVLMNIGCMLFGLAVLFTLVTLPVEWNASSRAKSAMQSAGLLLPAERDSAASVLNAAFLTYVAAAVSSILTLLYYLIITGALGGRRRD